MIVYYVMLYYSILSVGGRRASDIILHIANLRIGRVRTAMHLSCQVKSGPLKSSMLVFWLNHNT